MRSLRFHAGCQVQGGAVQLPLQAEKACPGVVVWLQVHGGDVASLAIESKERIENKREFILTCKSHFNYVTP